MAVPRYLLPFAHFIPSLLHLLLANLDRAFNSDSMEKGAEGEKGDWMSVPAFGEWEKQQGMSTDYSVDFSKIRQMRKQNKSDYSRISVGNETEFPPRSDAASSVTGSGASAPPAVHHQHSPSGRKKFMNYFVCCIGV